MSQQRFQQRLIGRVRYQQHFAQRLMQRQPIVERVSTEYHRPASHPFYPAVSAQHISALPVENRSQLQEQIVLSDFRQQDRLSEQQAVVSQQQPEVLQPSDQSDHIDLSADTISILRENEHASVSSHSHAPYPVVQASRPQDDSPYLHSLPSDQLPGSHDIVPANESGNNNRSVEPLIIGDVKEENKQASVQQPKRQQLHDQVQSNVLNPKDNVQHPMGADVHSDPDERTLPLRGEAELPSIIQPEIQQAAALRSEQVQEKITQRKDRRQVEEHVRAVARSVVQPPLAIQGEQAQEEIVSDEGQHQEQQHPLSISELSEVQLAEIPGDVEQESIIQQEDKQYQGLQKQALPVSQTLQVSSTISRPENPQTEHPYQEDTTTLTVPRNIIAPEKVASPQNERSDISQQSTSNAYVVEPHVAEADAHENPPPETVKTSARQTRRRSRIEEHPQSSQPQQLADQSVAEQSPSPAIPSDQQKSSANKPSEQQPSTSSTSTFSPQEWLARLLKYEQSVEERKQKEKEQEIAHAEPPVDLTRSDPSSLSEHAQQILEPLVGIDPASVEIHQGPLTDPVSRSYHADAVTVGETIILASDQRGDTPETLGLLAHELTHVARKRTPRFVPPVVRSVVDAQADPTHAQMLQSTPPFSRINAVVPPTTRPVSGDEETVAHQVEASVANVARSLADRPATEIPAVAPSAPTDRAMWSDLPAPWEPLPDWLLHPSATQESHPTISAPTVSTQHGSPDVAGNTVSDPSFVQRAGQERSLNLSESRHGATDPPDVPAEQIPEPDLDDLARQVYMRIKRRLGVEARRDR